jgi:hypothetical protein
MQDFMAGYLEQSVAAFMRQQESVQQQISKMLSNAPPPMNAMAEITRQNMEMWNRMQEGMLAFMGWYAAGRQLPRAEIRAGSGRAGRSPRTEVEERLAHPPSRTQNRCCFGATTVDKLRASGVS